MAQTFLIFDFGSDENAAQSARHRIEGWKQGFRLDKKMQLKFDRTAEPEAEQSPANSQKAKGKARQAKQTGAGEQAESPEDIRLIIRLDFSDHERLSHQRWADRIPSDDAFKAAHPKIIRSGDTEFAATAEHFDSLD